MFYLIKSGLCLAILLAFYHLVLEREKMHQFNRFYLLGSVLFSFLAPLYIIYVEPGPEVLTNTSTADILIDTSTQEATTTTNAIDYTQYLWYLYIAISVLLSVRFVKSLTDLLLKIRKNTVIPYQKAKIVLVNDKILPHTFWNYIFINKEEYEAQKIEKELFTHELTHVTQRHTLDVLLIEALQIVLWFNPFFYPLKKAIQLNHEFLADDKVIASHQNISQYQYLLLDKAAWKNKYYLASNLNYSLTKKRLLMMKTPNSSVAILLKKLAIVPLLSGLVFCFAERVEAQTKKKKPEVIEVNLELTKAEMQEYTSLLQVLDKKKVYKYKDIVRMRDLYDRMSAAQKESVKSYRDILPPPPPAKLVEKKISAKKYEALKNKKKYAVWIDGKSVDNKELNKYSHTDFVSYMESFVYKNARSKKYPQEYQFTLFTKPHFEKVNKRMARNIPPPPKPIKIEVVKKDKKLPPPPPPAKGKKGKKAPKPVKIEVIKKESKVPPPPKKTVKVTELKKELDEKATIIEEIEEVETPMAEIELREVPEGVEEEEEIEVIEEVEVPYKEYQEKLALKVSFEDLKKQNTTFYLNGKKVAARKVKKYFDKKTDEVQTIDIIKSKRGKVKVKLTTR